ncbi:MAG TPA: polysaccharide biosynthesis tyrosine autokinase [Holophagaceae bacterium]|nr:polysaccharide biosynthesis tyrosine autokinase [Holophagaceae bacterium]
MSPVIPPDPRQHSSVNSKLGDPNLAARGEETLAGEWMKDLWDGRWILIVSMASFLLIGLFMIWKAVPMYQVEALLKVQGKKSGVSDPSFAKMEGMFADPTEAQAEIEILKSGQVLGKAAETLKLDVVAEPILTPVVGRALMRGNPEAPRIEIESFEVPALLRGQAFRVTALGPDTFRLDAMRPSFFGTSPAFLGNGRVGEPLTGTFAGESVTLIVQSMFAKEGQPFFLVRRPLPDVISDLRLAFDASERGKLTNVLGLTYKNTSSTLAATTLNTIVDAYVRNSIERKASEIQKTQAALEAKLPELKAKVTAAESALNQFRARTGSVDLSREADIYLQQSTGLNNQITGLRQKKEELLRTYKETSDVVTTLDQQIERLKTEAAQADQKVRALPGIQQEVVRLTRDVQVNTELYTALLNNIQQLQVAKDSDIGSVSVVDLATPSLAPIGPKKSMQLAFYLFLGAVVGGGVIMVKKALRRGIEDHHLIESRLGIPVLVTVPHSDAQDEASAAATAGNAEGLQLLAALHPNELAIESMRSLRTSIQFAMNGASNRVIMLAGPCPGIGKSFVSSNLAAVMAQAGAKVLIVDADLRRGNLHQCFGLRDRENGLSQVLAGRGNWNDLIHKTAIPGLDLLTSGTIPTNPSDLLLDKRLGVFLKEASEAYDFVIVDAPPVLPVTDATILGAQAGTVILVAKYGQHPVAELRTCQRRLEDHGVRIHGCVFNDLLKSGIGDAYGNYKYAYHYTYKGQS